MAEGNERSGKSYGGGHKGYGDRDRQPRRQGFQAARQGRFQAAS